MLGDYEVWLEREDEKYGKWSSRGVQREEGRMYAVLHRETGKAKETLNVSMMRMRGREMSYEQREKHVYLDLSSRERFQEHV